MPGSNKCLWICLSVCLSEALSRFLTFVCALQITKHSPRPLGTPGKLGLIPMNPFSEEETEAWGDGAERHGGWSRVGGNPVPSLCLVLPRK